MGKQETKQNILEAACKLFAASGFNKTTHQQIAAESGANSALINYYFSNKENLYFETWAYAKTLWTEEYGDPVKWELPADEWIKTYLGMKVQSIFNEGPAGMFLKLIHREMVHGGSYRKELKERFLKPQLDRLEQAVFELIGDKVCTHELRTVVIGIHMQYVFLNAAPNSRNYMFETDTPSKEQLEDHARYITDSAFALIASRMHKGAIV